MLWVSGLVAIVGSCFFFYPSVSRAIQIRSALEQEIHVIWRDLESGKIGAGEPLDSVLALHPTTHVEQFGDYALVRYYKDGDRAPGTLSFSGLFLTAKDGRLLSATAASCTWSKEFFDTMSAADQEAQGAKLEFNCP